ncbi:type II toxin-antitoxin system RelE/ParE family toxin [Terrimonas pollutisoli]|uniref:type II toxin-antitoxin system RelE/ParE family toxin n=1 Tax=Terrimonas pollutisoli TaxID=3034147 RepID=UPI003F6A5744
MGNNCYKIRLAIASKGKGKSGGARLITFVKLINEVVLLISIYDKSVKENISVKELNDRLKPYLK